MSHRPNAYTSPNASGLVRAAFESGRDRGHSATPQPMMQNQPSQQPGSMINGNNSPSGFTARPNMSQQSVRSGPFGSSAPQSPGGAPINRPTGFTSHPNTSQTSVRSAGGPQNVQIQTRQGPNQSGPTIHPSASQSSLRWGGSQSQGPPLSINPPRFANNQNPNQQSFRSGPSQMQGGPLHNRNDSSSSGSSSDSESLQTFNGSNSNPAVPMNLGRVPPSQQSQGRGSMNPHQNDAARLSAAFNERLKSLHDKILKFNGPKDFQQRLLDEVRSIAQDFNELQQKFENIQNEKADLRQQLEKALKRIEQLEQNLKRVDSERHIALRERDEISQKCGQLTLKSQRDDEQLKIQGDMLDNKRGLWLDSHPDPSPRRDAMIKQMSLGRVSNDSFISPSRSQSSRPGSNSNLGSPTTSSSFTASLHSDSSRTGSPSQKSRRRDNFGNDLDLGGSSGSHSLPTGTARPDLNPRGHYEPGPGAEYGDDELFKRPRYNSSSAEINELMECKIEWHRTYLGKFFQMIEGWSGTYSTTPNPETDQRIGGSDQEVWEFMLKCLNPYKVQEAHTHVMALLRDPHTRFWFITRVIAQYCVDKIFNIEAWYTYNRSVEQTFLKIKKEMNAMKGKAQENLVEERSQLVKTIVDASDYQNFREGQIEHHSLKLRKLTAYFLDTHVNRDRSFKDLHGIVRAAWEVSVKINLSSAEFIAIYPPTGSKFGGPELMIAKDRLHEDPKRLQLQQTRLKLIISPAITLHENMGTTIYVKNLVRATVLLMD